MRTIITIIMAVITLIPASADKYLYNFRNTPISEAIVRISKEHPEVNIFFIYNELDDYTTSAEINTEDTYEALRSAVGVNPISVVQRGDNFYVEALQHGDYTIHGCVVDGEAEPIVAGVVYILSTDGAKPVTYGITDANGCFKIPCDSSDVTLKISYLGHNDFEMPVPSSGNCGTITLAPETVMLGEVVVKSNRPVTEIKGDALVTNVAGSQLEHAGTAEDVLIQVPMVLGRDGNFEVFGKGSPAIYIIYILMVERCRTLHSSHS
ncbi:MAG: carboxypeptidase-like regulatory domain-containing protein [Muribaculaceae bacterium]|nr:carboxypeptidase-like regulatory domain-containing protein [Muribaculaceae bacterium]